VKKASNLNIKLPIIFCSVALCLVAALHNSQNIVDYVLAATFQPSSELTGIVAKTGLNDRGSFYLYASQPKLESSSDFNSYCTRVENVTSILGCYNKKRIYVYNVKDSKLDGVREVTIAHEALHAIYDRLSVAEKAKIDKLLESEYTKLKSDEGLTSRMAFYERNESGQFDNELHSVLGTEVGSISPELENYYKQYFSDRQKIIALNQKYLGVFKALSESAEQISNQITALANQITSETSEYNEAASNLSSQITNFNVRANNGGFLTLAQFNNERAMLVAQINNLERRRTEINSNISSYDSLIKQYNSIATETTKLYNSLDSSLATAPSI